MKATITLEQLADGNILLRFNGDKNINPTQVDPEEWTDCEVTVMEAVAFLLKDVLQGAKDYTPPKDCN